jgi:hypothetical protein
MVEDGLEAVDMDDVIVEIDRGEVAEEYFQSYEDLDVSEILESILLNESITFNTIIDNFASPVYSWNLCMYLYCTYRFTG